jgi:hypothetical protein
MPIVHSHRHCEPKAKACPGESRGNPAHGTGAPQMAASEDGAAGDRGWSPPTGPGCAILGGGKVRQRGEDMGLDFGIAVTTAAGVAA